jgi:large subunit ribosomal protein L15
MPTRYRKVRKMRGSRTHGWGVQAQHRRRGRKGGRGKAGTHKHKWVPPAPKYAGKRGFKSLRKESKVINVEELDALVEKGEVSEVRGKVVIDLHEMGYDKLLGRGKISKPVFVKVKYASKRALEKIEASGGGLVGNS